MSLQEILANLKYNGLLFEYAKEKLNMDLLRTEFCGKLEDYEVLILKVDKLIKVLDRVHAFSFPELCVDTEDTYMEDLINLAGRGVPLIPPELRFIGEEYGWRILDGQHRFKLICFCEMEEVPFLIPKNQLGHANNLIVRT